MTIAQRRSRGRVAVAAHPLRRLAAALAVALMWGLWDGTAPAHAAVPACDGGISRATTERLFAVLNRPPAAAECKFEGVDTTRAMLEARWTRGGTPLSPIRVVPRECAPPTARLAGRFGIDVPAELAQACPSVVPLIAEFQKQLASEAPVSGDGGGWLFGAARALFAGIVVLAGGLLLRGARRFRTLDPRWVVLGMAGFSATLALRAALPFSLGNWYSEVLPAVGPPPWMRFGPGYFAFQSLLRDVGIWNPHSLVVSQLLLGATAAPLLLGILREIRAGLAASAATLVLLVCAPFHARLSASPSEHVLASTLCLGLLLCWLRAARTGDVMWWASAVLLFPATCATRVDMVAQASAVLLWPLARDRVERRSDLGGSRRGGYPRCWQVAMLGVVAAATLATVYYLVALPSHHPLPEPAAQMFALRSFIPEHWLLATRDPGWIPLPAVLLAAVGGAAMTLRRPWLLVRVAGTLGVAFAALGRSFLPDELLGARYFLFTIPIFLIAAGQGFAALLRLVPQRNRRVAAATGVVALGLWSAMAARTAYSVRYAFQDEYTFARGALGQLRAGCTVYEVPLRPEAFPRDLDCCLDVVRSPLVLDFPQLTFQYLPPATTAVFADPGCVAYYESIACAIRDDPNDPSVHDRAGQAAAYLQQRCAEVRRVGRLDPLAETTTSPRATVNFFRGERPHAGLYRWRP